MAIKALITDETGKAIKDALAGIQQAVQQRGQGGQGGGVSISVETDPEALTTLSQSVVYFLAPGTWAAFSPAVTVPAGKFGIAKYGTAWAVTVLGGGELASAIAAMTAADELTGDEALPMGSGESVTVQQLAEFAEDVIGGNAAHATSESADQAKLASAGKVMELIGEGRRVIPVTSAPATLSQSVIYLVHGSSSDVTIGTATTPADTTAYVYHDGNGWVVVEDDSDVSLETLKKLSYGGQGYLFDKNAYDFIWNSTTNGSTAAKKVPNKTVTTFGIGILSFSFANTATAPTLFENPIYLDDGEGNLTAASDVNTWSDGDVFEVRVADVEVGGVSGIKTIMKKVPYLKRGRLEVNDTTVTISDSNPTGSTIDLVAGPFDIKAGAHYEIHTTRYSASFPVVVSVDDDDSVVDSNSTNQSGLFAFSAGAKKFYVHCYNMNKNDLSVREIITFGGDDNYKSIVPIEDGMKRMKLLNPWAGKTVIAFGASGTYGITPVNFPDEVGTLLECNMSNHAGSPRYYNVKFDDGGNVIATYQSIYGLAADNAEKSGSGKTWEDYFTSDLDLVIFGGGDTDCITNNGEADKTLINNLVFPLAEGQHFTYSDGTTLKEHRDTYIGAIIYLLDKLWTISPKCRVVFVEDYFFIGSPGDAPKSGKSVEITNLLCQKLHIPCINVHEKVGWNWYNKSEYMADAMHPNEEGTRRIAKMIANDLLLIA